MKSGPRALHPAVVLSWALALPVGACSREAARTTTEADRVTRAVEALRQAPNDAKPQWLSALKATECRSEDVCRLKTLCAEAYERHVRALEALRAVKAALSADAADDGALELLRQSETQLARAKSLAEDCATLEAELRRTYKL